MNNELYRKLRKRVFLNITYKNNKIDAVKNQDYENAAFWRELERENFPKLTEALEEIKN